jgi:bifunctional UDP-N-acetylglucosamine pyrophosphorylase/glucosamine-1-phosphate N-acetyltransferase
VLEDGVEVGAFVEVNRSHVGTRTIIRHLAYVGDAELGEGVNFGATAVTANYDGVSKNNTQIGAGSRIGAGAVLVAPVSVGRDAVVGANAVVTRGHDVADGQTVVGVPARPAQPSRG